MPSLTMRAARHGPQLHQKNWGAGLTAGWRQWCLRWERHSQRKSLRELANDPHLLADIGMTREEALEEADKSVFELNDVYLHSI